MHSSAPVGRYVGATDWLSAVEFQPIGSDVNGAVLNARIPKFSRNFETCTKTPLLWSAILHPCLGGSERLAVVVHIVMVEKRKETSRIIQTT